MALPEQESLADRVRRYPVDRYPVQHATAQFHLGSALLHGGDATEALERLRVARDVFSSCGLELEAAKATMMLGVALRAVGRHDDAAHTFTDAAEALGALDHVAEQAAATYNLGLVLQDRGDVTGAHDAWVLACERFLTAGYPAQAAAALRDHGASLLATGESAAAVALLERAAALAERSGDDVGTAAAGNALGLAHLATGDSRAAVAALRRALAFAPRTVRPADHAMIKANLALAYEQHGDRHRARLAALQAGAIASAALPVRHQAQAILARLPGRPADDLFAVLDHAERSEWQAVVREEVLRIADLAPSERARFVGDFLAGAVDRSDTAHALAEALLAVVLELPPKPYASLVDAFVVACASCPPDDRDRAQAIVSSAMARFAIPQWQRLAASLNAAAEAAGQPATWR